MLTKIGRAFSADGINWIRDTLNNPLLHFGNSNDWDDGFVFASTCLNLNDTLFMWYMGGRLGAGNGSGIGQAFSTDNGITWAKDQRNPIIKRGTSTWDGDYIEFPMAILVSDTIYLYYGASRESTGSNLWRIGLAKSIREAVATHVNDTKILPKEFLLKQNYPNPFNPNTIISYQLPVGGNVSIKVFDILGNEIRTLVDEYKPAGSYEYEFNAASLPSGVYFYSLHAGMYNNTKKMLLMK